MSIISSFANDPLLIVIAILGAIAIILLVLVIWMYLKLRKFLVAGDAKNIGESLTKVSGQLSELQEFKSGMEEYLTGVEKRLRKSVQSVSTVRFNPFKGTGGGGNQSFATAFLDEDGDGVVISSLYARDHVSVFSKPIKKHASDYELSEEEKQAVDGAKK
jgi:hypothetical protein